MLETLTRILPPELGQAVRLAGPERIEEIRLRAGQAPSIVLGGKEQPLAACTSRVTAGQLQRIVMIASSQSQYAVQDQLRCGFFSVEGGIRIGVCGGTATLDGRVTAIRDISSLNIRLPHEIVIPAQQLLPHLTHSCLLVGAPGSGKTTLLRSCIRALTQSGQRVGVADERMEIAAARGGVPQFDLGPRADVLSGCPKGEGMLMLLRSMNPDWIAVDEITQPEDLLAIRDVNGCGVRLLATIHAETLSDLTRRPLCRMLVKLGIFEQALLLDRSRTFHAERILC